MDDLTFCEDGHVYELDGERIPSVSDLCRFIRREVYADAPAWQMEAAAERGTKVHAAAEALDMVGTAEIEDEYLPYMMEADTFANQQKYVKPLLPYDIFVANLEAGNDKQLMIKALVESMDLSIGPTKALGTICAVSSLEEIYDKHGYHVLERTLMLCIGAWEGEQNSLSANMLKGVCRMVVAYGDSMRDDLFVEKVGRFSAKDISRTAKERRAGSLGYAEAMLLAYNRKMRYPLRWGKLYNKKGTEDMGPDVETDMEPDDSEDD